MDYFGIAGKVIKNMEWHKGEGTQIHHCNSMLISGQSQLKQIIKKDVEPILTWNA